MKLTLRYFASMKELMKCESQSIDLVEPVSNVGALMAHLKECNPEFAASVAEIGRLRVAVNMEMAEEDTALSAGAEVAFFPPVTGG